MKSQKVRIRMSGKHGSHLVLRTELKRFLKFFLSELKPKGNILTPFNVISAIILVVGAVILTIRFTKGLGAVANFSQDYPWGLWVSFNVITGVAFAGGAYVLTFMVYILKVKKYHPIVRVTVLNGFLAYVFYAGALVLDLGRPWKVINPIIGNSFGVSSVMFLVAWHFMLYMLAEFIEFSPAVAEWLGWKKIRKIMGTLTLGVVIFGITLSTLHQSGLGALFLMAKSKIHPLWYSEFIPILFFISSIFAGLSVVILERSISNKVFRHQLSPEHYLSHDNILLGLSKICAGTMFVYLFLKILVFVHGQHYSLLNTPMGYWFLTEVIGFVLIPGILFTQSVKTRNILFIKIGAVMTIIGIILNRLNTSMIAFNWEVPVKYFPSWMEIEVTLAVIIAEILVFRWIVNRMPILSEPPEWAREHKETKEKIRPIKIEEESERWKVSVI
jgi:Ni/Fe-hydrogenase subunit HybB-like protein